MSRKSVARRDLLKGAALGTAAAAASFPAPAIAQETYEWKLLTTWPKNFPGLGTGAQRLADSITAMSDGRLKIKLFAAGELVPAFEVFDTVRAGNAQMGHGASYYWVAKHKSTPFYCTVPAGLTAQEHEGWLYHGGGQELWDELYGEFGLQAFLCGGTGIQMGGWFQKEINSLDDIKGIKMRIPGLGAEVINRLGGTAVNLPGGEIMPALQSGVIDATEWVGPWNDLAFGFYKIAKFYYGPGFHEPSSALECMINKEAYEGLPKDLQEIVKFACAAQNSITLAEFTAANSNAQRVLTEKHGVTINNFPEDVIKSAFATSIDVVSETADEGKLAKKIFESWWNFRKDAVDRAPYAERGYMNNRAL